MTATDGRIWRLIVDGAGTGSWNMAVDRAILEAHEGGSKPPTLRLYRWDRPTVSIGRFQKVTDLDPTVIAWHGIGLCRRPTGGRGVLHDDELTYSVVAGVADGIPRGVAASYRVLCGALVEAYRTLGVEAALTSGRRGDAASPACYLHATAADLSLGAAKLSGSAQVWTGGSCLQHGSFVVSRNLLVESEVFRLDGEARRRLADATLTLVDACGEAPSADELTRAVVGGFERALGVRFTFGDLGDDERSRALELESGFMVDSNSWT